MMTPFLLGLLGACVGSFLNVCLFRWKSGGQVVTPSSFCPRCEESILWFDNIPILSFLLLKGKCRFCSKPISVQYPLVEAFTGALFFFLAIKFLGNPLLLVVSLFFASFMVLFIVSDLKWRLLPHPFNNFFIAFGILFSGLLSHAPYFSGLESFRAASAFLLIGAPLFGLGHFFPNGFGGGDIKMVAGLAVWMGVSKTVYAFMIACSAAALFFFALRLSKRVSWAWRIPFGPFLAFGAMAVWLSSERNGGELS